MGLDDVCNSSLEIAENFLSSVFNKSTWNYLTWLHDKKHRGIDFKLVRIRLTNTNSFFCLFFFCFFKEVTFVFKEECWQTERFPLAWFDFTLANRQARQNPSTKKPRGSCRPVTWRKNHMVSEGRETAEGLFWQCCNGPISSCLTYAHHFAHIPSKDEWQKRQTSKRDVIKATCCKQHVAPP